MEIGRSFTFPFQDKSWFSKLLIAAVVSIVPIVNFALVGWMVDLAKRVMDHELEELPGWDEFGKKWMGGLYYTVAGFIYALPVILVSCILFAITFGSTFAAAQEGNTDEVIGAIMAGNSVVVICLSCLMAIYGLVLSVLMPALMVHYAKEGSFGAMFKLGTVFGKVRENAGPFFLAWLVTLVFGFLVGLVMSGMCHACRIDPLHRMDHHPAGFFACGPLHFGRVCPPFRTIRRQGVRRPCPDQLRRYTRQPSPCFIRNPRKFTITKRPTSQTVGLFSSQPCEEKHVYLI